VHFISQGSWDKVIPEGSVNGYYPQHYRFLYLLSGMLSRTQCFGKWICFHCQVKRLGDIELGAVQLYSSPNITEVIQSRSKGSKAIPQ
jgi:hypothetical protein